MSELPRVMAARFVADYGLPEYDAGQLTQSKATAAYFEAVATASKQPKLASNWVMGELSRRLNAQDLDIGQSPVSAATLAAIIGRISDGTVSNAGARQVFELLWAGGELGKDALPEHVVDKAIDELGLKQISDTGELEKIIDTVLAANAKNVAEVKAGNVKAMNALVGQAMKATQGKANPAQINALLKSRLDP